MQERIDIIDDEEWRDIKGYENLYQVSNKLRVRSLYNYKRNGTNILKPKIKHGYYQIGLRKNKIRKWHQVHRLLAEAFIPDKSNFKSMPYEDRSKIDLNKLEVNHKDENKLNNSIDNLEWCTTAYNNCYGNRLENVKKKNSKPVIKYDKNGDFLEEYSSVAEASRQNKVSAGNIVNVCKGRYRQINGYIYAYK